jgi:uncharacterized protein
MDLFIVLVNSFYDLSNAMAIYILLGLIFAGVLHELVPESLVTKHLGKESVASVLKATFFGIPLPVCSCGVIPLASSIKKSGASSGATLSFLISTPITGVDAILATFGMFGWIFTFYRVVTSMLIAIAAGILTNLYDTPVSISRFSVKKPPEQSQKSCCSSAPERKKFSLYGVYQYAFGNLLGDIAKPLLWGLVLGALITVMIPSNLSAILIAHPYLSYFIVIAIAAPMYVCATSSLPIAAALMLSGVSPGAAFVFLTAGPATNTVTIGVVKEMLGKRALMIYLSVIVIGSVLFGVGLDMLFLVGEISVLEMIHLHEEASWIEIGSSFLLWGLILSIFIKPFLKKEHIDCCSSDEGDCR